MRAHENDFERGLIRAYLGYVPPPNLNQLPAVEDTGRLIEDLSIESGLRDLMALKRKRVEGEPTGFEIVR